MIAGRKPAGLVEVRYRMTGGRPGMGQMWVPCAEPRPFVGTVLGLGEQTDVYVGAAPRRERNGGKRAVEAAWALWVDCDDAEAADRLRAFEPAPTMLVRSGREGALHGWWSLSEPLAAPDNLERALSRLAHCLGADSACCDAGRIMRAAGTFNHKRGEPVPVAVERLEVHAYSADDVVGALPAPPATERGAARSSSPTALPSGDDSLLSIEPAVYIEALTGREVGRDRKVTCPFHDDRTPSLHVYETPEQGWACFSGCGGGTIIDFGAKLYATEPRGSGYHKIRERLERDLRAALSRWAA